MNTLQVFFAQTLLPTDVIPGASRWMGLTMTELLVLFGAVAFVTLLLVVWAVYFRKPPKQHSRHYHYPSETVQSGNAEGEPESNGERRYRRKRRRRREHRPRNPTLAETGGLPPLRSERPQDPLP